jgi:N-acetylglutamate synthase-like GNAT family acetyltransferase
VDHFLEECDRNLASGAMTTWALFYHHESHGMEKGREEIVSSCQRLKTEGHIKTHQHTPIGIHGLASVYTEPQHRGKGYAERMILSLCHSTTGKKKEEAWLLYSDVGTPYYAKMGFRPLDVDLHDLEWRCQLTTAPQSHVDQVFTDVDVSRCVEASRTWWALYSKQQQDEQEEGCGIIVDPVWNQYDGVLLEIERMAEKYGVRSRPMTIGARRNQTTVLWYADPFQGELNIALITYDLNGCSGNSHRGEGEPLQEDLMHLITYARHVGRLAGLHKVHAWRSNLPASKTHCWPVGKSNGCSMSERKIKIPMMRLAPGVQEEGALHCACLPKLCWF